MDYTIKKQDVPRGENGARLCRLSTGDSVCRAGKSIAVRFSGRRGVLSTSLLNGGYRRDLEGVFHNDCKLDGKRCKIRTEEFGDYLRLVASKLRFAPERATGLSTAANMDNVSIRSETFRQLTVTAIVTGGIEINGGRVGDPASYYEEKGSYFPLRPGTINIILVVDACLPEWTLVRALVTCTEAKTAALQELMTASRYSSGIATGSGTDGTVVVANDDSSRVLTDAGKHSKLGELIGKSVKCAVKEALYRQTGVCPARQHSVFRRAERYGIDREKVWDCGAKSQGGMEENRFRAALDRMDRESGLVVQTSLYVHLLDELEWDMITPQEAETAGAGIAGCICRKAKAELKAEFEWHPIDGQDRKTAVRGMTENYVRLLSALAVGLAGV